MSMILPWMGRTNEGRLDFCMLSEFLFDIPSDSDSRSGHDVVKETTNLKDGDLVLFENDLDDDLEDISLFD